MPCVLLLVMFASVVHTGYCCPRDWVAYVGKKIAIGHVIGPILTKPDEIACQNACNPADCRLVQYNSETRKCKRYAYSMEEVTELQYVSTAAEQYTVYECPEANFRQCCLIGDPWLKPYHNPDTGHLFKIEFDQNGVFSFSKTVTPPGGDVCEFRAVVRTAVTDPNREHRSVVTHLYLQIGSSNITLVHTPLIDEIPALHIDENLIAPLPTDPADYSPIYVSEHNGNVVVRHQDCDISLTFSDFKNSRTCLQVIEENYVDNLSGMCGQVNEPMERDSFNPSIFLETNQW